MKTLEEHCLEKQCIERLNNILSKFNLQIVKVNWLDRRQYRLIYKNDTANWIESWLSISDMLFTRTISRYLTNSIFECLKTYYLVVSNPLFNRRNMRKDILYRFQDCSAAYKEIQSLKSDSFEEFIIKCDLMGV